MSSTPMHLTDKSLFQEWMQQPMTVEFFQYLKDRQWALMERWGEGTAGSHLPETQAQAVFLGQLAATRWDDIAAHYDLGGE